MMLAIVEIRQRCIIALATAEIALLVGIQQAGAAQQAWLALVAAVPWEAGIGLRRAAP